MKKLTIDAATDICVSSVTDDGTVVGDTAVYLGLCTEEGDASITLNKANVRSLITMLESALKDET